MIPGTQEKSSTGDFPTCDIYFMGLSRGIHGIMQSKELSTCLTHSEGSTNSAVIDGSNSYTERLPGPVLAGQPVTQASSQKNSVLGLMLYVTILKFLVLFQQGTSHLHFARSSITYKAGPGDDSSLEIHLLAIS